jgi:serine/threonine protein kinase
MDNLLERHLGNYRLTRLLGKGGFASVYLGTHHYLGTQAAIKVMETRLVDEQIVQFQNEARTIAHLVHPHIVRVLEFGVEEGTPFLVMDYATAGTLRTLHPRGTQVPLARILRYVQQIALALDYAHQKRLIHRDIKPENLLLGREDRLWLSDFGLAVIAHSSSSLHTEQAAGTVPYMAPEQFQGKPRPASDQYALAIMVYEWLSGLPPFSGTTLEIAMQHMAAAPPPLAGAPPGVQEALLTALAKDPGQRFPNVQAFAAALHRASAPAATFTPAQPSAPPAAAQEDPRPEPFAAAPPAAVPLSQVSTHHLQPASLSPPTPPAPHPTHHQRRRERAQPRQRWLIALAALAAILLASGILLIPRAAFWGTGSALSGAATPPTAAGNNPATNPAQPGLTSTPGIAGTAGTAGTAPTTGNASPTAAGTPTPTPASSSPTPTSATAPGKLVAAPLSLSFSLTLVSCLLQAPSKTITLTNQGGSPTSWQTSIENPAYLSVAPASGSLGASQNSNITVTVICPSISLNTVDHITILWGGAPIIITVMLSIL